MPEDRIFDFNKPDRVQPSPTSRPVIVGHRPTTTDPMMRGSTRMDMVSGKTPAFTSGGNNSDAPALFDQPEGSSLPAPAAASPANLPNEPLPTGPSPRIEELHLKNSPKRRRRWPKILLIILLLLAAAYLLIDSGVIKAGVKMPFHVFKQKTTSANSSAAVNNNAKKQAAATAVPAGFQEYKIKDTAVTFAAPSTWGTPTSSTDPGYSLRGGAYKPDGTYAYIIDFAGNKDVEVAVTSSKYLPEKRGTQYFDFLQWCTGTNDGKYYMTTMHYNTSTDKVDSPSTTSCDQGPVAALKVEDTTIMQAKVASVDGKVLGDIYTKNLPNKALPVFRVKDASSANGAQIKQMLTTVKVPQTGSGQ